MSELLQSLVDRTLKDVIRHEHSWSFSFDNDNVIAVECLWRLLDASKICCTSEDDGHQFGLPSPVDAEAVLRASLIGKVVQNVLLDERTHDLSVRFNSGHELQLVPDSAGYESWRVQYSHLLLIARAGGELSIWTPESPNMGNSPDALYS